MEKKIVEIDDKKYVFKLADDAFKVYNDAMWERLFKSRENKKEIDLLNDVVIDGFDRVIGWLNLRGVVPFDCAYRISRGKKGFVSIKFVVDALTGRCL